MGNGNPVLKVPSFPYTLDAGTGYTSYHWSTGSTQHSINIPSAGSYAVTVTASNGCTTNSSVVVEIGTSVQNFTGQEISINAYPIPFSNELNVQVEQATLKDFTLEIWSMRGQLVYQSAVEGDSKYFEIIDMSDYVSGIYLLKVYNKEYRYIGKIIKR